MKREISPRREQPEPPQERPSFADVYDKGAGYVWRMLRRLGLAEDDCPDATQDVFVIVHRRLPEYEPRNRLHGWLAAITANVAAQYRDRDRRQPRADGEVDPTDLAEPHLPPFDLEDAVAARELALYLLQDIEPNRRLVLIMHDVDELLTREIADALGIPKGTVETRLRLARKDLRAAWTRYEARMRHETKSAPLLLIFGPLTLLEAERNIPPLPDGMHERIWSRLQHLQPVGGGGGGGGGGRVPPAAAPGAALGGAGSVTLSATKAAVAFAGTLALGVVLGAVWDPFHATPAPLAARADAAVAAQTAVPSSVPSAAPPSSTAWVPAESASASTATPATDTATERALMNRAAVAFAAGDTAGALAAVEEHDRRFHGGGRLAETREAVWISTLLGAGRVDEARARIERYGRLYPTSPRLEGFRKAASGSR